MSQVCENSHFKDEKTEAQRSKVTVPRVSCLRQCSAPNLQTSKKSVASSLSEDGGPAVNGGSGSCGCSGPEEAMILPPTFLRPAGYKLRQQSAAGSGHYSVGIRAQCVTRIWVQLRREPEFRLPNPGPVSMPPYLP